MQKEIERTMRLNIRETASNRRLLQVFAHLGHLNMLYSFFIFRTTLKMSQGGRNMLNSTLVTTHKYTQL